MARRGRFKRFARRAGRSAFRRSSRKGSSALGWGFLVGAGVYGAVREKASNMLTPLTSKVPLGNVADEVVMGAINYFGAKNTSGVVREIFKAGMTIEAARIGETIANGQLNMGGSSNVGSSAGMIG